MPMSSAPGQNPGPVGQASTADGQAPDAAENMSAACVAAADAAVSQRQQEGRKVAMGM
jgi:hypothetical protein